MAKRKRTTAPEVPSIPSIPSIPLDQLPDHYPRSPDALAKIGEHALGMIAAHEQRKAAAVAKETIERAGKRSRRRPSAREMDSMASRLLEVGFTLVAIHNMAAEALDNERAEHILNLMRAATRSATRAVDACIVKLQGGGAGMGNFADDLALD